MDVSAGPVMRGYNRFSLAGAGEIQGHSLAVTYRKEASYPTAWAASSHRHSEFGFLAFTSDISFTETPSQNPMFLNEKLTKRRNLHQSIHPPDIEQAVSGRAKPRGYSGGWSH